MYILFVTCDNHKYDIFVICDNQSLPPTGLKPGKTSLKWNSFDSCTMDMDYGESFAWVEMAPL